VVAIDPDTGRTQYFEYGRYDKAQMGVVRQKHIPNVQIGPDGNPTPASLANLYAYLSKNLGEGSHVSVKYYGAADYDKIVAFARKRMNDPNRAPYSWVPWRTNDCKTFAHDAIKAGLN
jgi:hypothetical protein